MKQLNELLEKNKNKQCIILGDPSGINYYLNMSEYKGLFDRPFESLKVICDERFFKYTRKRSN